MSNEELQIQLNKKRLMTLIERAVFGLFLAAMGALLTSANDTIRLPAENKRELERHVLLDSARWQEVHRRQGETDKDILEMKDDIKEIKADIKILIREQRR